MKYLSVLFFAVALAWTWNTIHSKPNLDSETHAGIQSAMAKLVRATVTAKKPQAQDFLIQKMRTEERENGEVRVHFQYAYSEPDAGGLKVTSQVAGIAVLEKSTGEQWSLKKVQATNDTISFEKGLVITAGPDDAALNPESPAPPQSETPAAPTEPPGH